MNRNGYNGKMKNNYLSLAGDDLNPVETAETFSRVQQREKDVVFKGFPAWPFWLIK